MYYASSVLHLENLTENLSAEVEPISTYVDLGEREFLVADERGYEHLLYKMAEDFLHTSEGKILDSRLQLNKVMRYCSVLNCCDFHSERNNYMVPFVCHRSLFIFIYL